jgi:hypothetical protein
MNPDTRGYSVSLTELRALADRADALAMTMRTSWQQDWFEDDKWPDNDPLRIAVITYRRSLQAAMERLGALADRMSANLASTAESYRDTDRRSADTFAHMIRADLKTERADGSVGS